VESFNAFCEILLTAFSVGLTAQSQKGGAIVRSKTMMDNLRRNDTKKGKRNEGEMKASQASAPHQDPAFSQFWELIHFA
jgi:hypothetical protein